MKMDHFCPALASFQLTISIFMGLPGFLLPFGRIINNRGSLLHDILRTWFVQFDLMFCKPFKGHLEFLASIIEKRALL